jgi:hypothetical protein
VILLHPAQYRENTLITKDGLELRSTVPQQARLLPPSGAALTLAADGLKLTDLRVHPGTGQGLVVSGAASGRVEVSGALFVGASGASVAIDAAAAGPAVELAVEDNEFRTLHTAIRTGSTSNASILDNVVQTVTDGIVLGAGSTGAVVTGNKVQSASRTGIEVQGSGHSVNGNRVLSSAGSALRVGGMNIEVRENELHGNGVGIRLLATLTGFHIIEKNEVRNNAVGVVTDMGLPAGAKVRHNDLQGNTLGAQATGGTSLDARFNWWGHPAGPTAGSGTQGSVTSAPWCAQPSCPVVNDPGLPLP